jgi:small subunit ribosomal protein S8
MSNNFLLSNLVSSVKNGFMVKKPVVVVPFSNINSAICDILKNEGFIEGYESFEVRKGVKQIKVNLKYVKLQSSIRQIELVSKPGRRMYKGYRQIKNYIDGLGVRIVSTNLGLMTDHEARSKKIGGEVVLNIF